MKRERAFLGGMCRIKPLVIFFDDVHWADASTTDLLGYLCSQFASMRLLIIVTYRPTDLLLAKHPFSALRLDLAARALCRELPLGFLTRDEAQRYLDLECPGHDFPTALADVIHGKTEGSPLFMVDLVRDLRDPSGDRRSWKRLDARPVCTPAIERDLPASVRSMIRRGSRSSLTRTASCSSPRACRRGIRFLRSWRRPSAAIRRCRGAALSCSTASMRSSRSAARVAARRGADAEVRFVHVLYQNELACVGARRAGRR
jgi:hypothetical protein